MILNQMGTRIFQTFPINFDDAAKPGSSKLKSMGAGIHRETCKHRWIRVPGHLNRCHRIGLPLQIFGPAEEANNVIRIYFSGMMVFSHSNIIFRAH
jgi:hypothetical protein